MARKGRKYSEEERSIALLFYDRIRQREADEDVAVKKAASMCKVEQSALLSWIGGKGVDTPEPEDEPWEAPDGIPMPPEHMQSFIRYPEDFRPAIDLAEWVRRHYIEEGGELYDPSFFHLETAMIAWEWTNVQNARNEKPIAALTQKVGGSGGGKWEKGRAASHLKREWGDLPHFIISVDSVWWYEHEDATRCALVDHELRHCGLKTSAKNGAPSFGKEGGPQFTVVGHDFEGFAGTIDRFGIEDAAEGGLSDIVAAIDRVRRRGPLIARASIASACGNCRR